jgi:hypothetical protein
MQYLAANGMAEQKSAGTITNGAPFYHKGAAVFKVSFSE